MNQHTKILCAAEPTAAARIHATMHGRYPYVFTSSFEDAKNKLGPNIGLILCGLDFGEHRMFDFLRYAKSNPQTSAIPFVCIQPNEAHFTSIIMQSIQISTHGLGAEEVIPLGEWRAMYGQEAALQKLLSRIDFYWEREAT